MRSETQKLTRKRIILYAKPDELVKSIVNTFISYIA